MTDYNLAHLELWTGRWDEALATAEAGLEMAERSGMAIERVHLRQLMCYVAIHRDDLELAASEADKMQGACWIPALLAEAKGDPAELGKWLDVYRTASVNNPLPWQMSLATWWGPDWVRLYLGIGDRTSALVMTEMLEEAARRSHTPTAKGAALRCRGLYEDDGDLLLKAVDVYRAGPRVFDRGQACEWAAGVLGRNPASADAAIGLLEEALTVYESVGATRAIAKAEAHLRSLGVRRGRRGPRGRPKSGWESLTPTEERVTALVGEGLHLPRGGRAAVHLQADGRDARRPRVREAGDGVPARARRSGLTQGSQERSLG